MRKINLEEKRKFNFLRKMNEKIMLENLRRDFLVGEFPGMVFMQNFNFFN
jgi:hypothetical protein